MGWSQGLSVSMGQGEGAPRGRTTGSLDNPRELSGCCRRGKQAGQSEGTSRTLWVGAPGEDILVSRSGSYSLMLVAAVLLLLSVSPGALELLLGSWLRGSKDLDLASRIFLGIGAVLVIISLVWVLRIGRMDTWRRVLLGELSQVAERVGGRVEEVSGGLRCWADGGLLGLLRLDLTLERPALLRLTLGSPGASPLLVLRPALGRLPTEWEPAAQGQGWELRAAPGTQGRRIADEPALEAALDRLFSAHGARLVRHDHGGVEVELELQTGRELEGAVEAAFAAAARLAHLNA